MPSILYEHPMNERIRNYLKLEQFFVQVNACEGKNIKHCHHIFFSAIFTIIDVLERNDIRGDLLKDLEKLEKNLISWSQFPQVNSNILEDNLRDAVQLTCQLKTTTPLWWQLREDKLLSGVKQRFAIQGGNASFDLPQLHFWLNQDNKTAEKDIKRWLHYLSHIHQALLLVLKFIRQRSVFETINTDSGFYQDSGEGILMLRIKIDQTETYYPTVSGNRFRYSIRFVSPCPDHGRQYSNKATKFELARC
jgi:cell division protein ZapD